MDTNRAGILAELGRFPFESIDFFDDLDRDQDIVLFKTEEAVGVVEEDVGINNVVFHVSWF